MKRKLIYLETTVDKWYRHVYVVRRWQITLKSSESRKKMVRFSKKIHKQASIRKADDVGFFKIVSVSS